MTLLTRCFAALVLAAVVLGSSPLLAKQTKPAAGADGVNVTVKYAGKGTVDATHRIWVWLFTTPEIGPGSIPIAEMSIEKNGATASFASVPASPVYIAIAYDEKGGFGGSAPPPQGSPVTFYGAKTPADKPAPVVPGAKGSVSVTLTDVQRMQ